MDIDLKSRKQVCLNQLTGLVEFMEEHHELAKGLTRGRRGKLHTLKLWNQCAKKLNVYKDGASKDGKGWSKYWCDWKYRVRRRALELKAAKDNNEEPPEGVSPLTAMEEHILTISGGNSIDNIVIKSDPLADGNTDGEETEEVNGVSSVNNYGTRSQSLRKSRKRRHSSREPSDMDVAGPSNPIEKHRIEERIIDDEASEFLRIEREKLEHSRRRNEIMQEIATDVRRLADVISHLRDVIINNRINI